ncbi:MAG: nucleoside monophosphate kinase [Bryobacteraceae bacterium]
MEKYIIIGPQGAGKGTQAQLLCHDYDFVHISVGDIFRWHMKHHTKLAARVTRIMHEGRLVPDEIVEEVVSQRLEQHDWNYGFVLDGFPRTRSQAEYLFERWNLDRAIYLDIPDEIVHQRVLARVAAGEGGGFTKRADDNPQALKMRLREFHEKTTPLLELFQRKNMLLTVDANRSIEDVYEGIREGLCLHTPSPRF